MRFLYCAVLVTIGWFASNAAIVFFSYLQREPPAVSELHKTLGQHILALGLQPNEELVFEVDFDTVSGFCVTAYDGKFEQSVGAGPESHILSDAQDKAFELAAEALRTVRMSSKAWPGPVPPAGTPEAAEMHEALHAAHEAYMQSKRDAKP